jgi:hypothetical protein
MSKKLELLKNKLKVRLKLAQAKAAKAIAQAIPDLIKIRTRLEGEGIKGKLKKLEKTTIAYRERYSQNLSSDTSPGESNLTATGQLLDSIKSKSVGSKVIAEFKKGKRKGELSGSKSKLTNQEVNKYVEKNGRAFFDLTKEEMQDAEDLATEIIKKEIKDVFNG